MIGGAAQCANDGCGRARDRVRTFVEEVWNRRNHEAASDLYAATHVNAFGRGPAARVEPIRRYHEAFPDLHIEIEELIDAGDTVVLRSTFRGTDTGGYAGLPPTGRTVDEWVVTIMHFDGERVVREWIGADKLGLFIQAGKIGELSWPRLQLVASLLRHHDALGSIDAPEPELLAEQFVELVAGIPARLASFGVIRGPEAQEHRLNAAVSLFLRGLQREQTGSK